MKETKKLTTATFSLDALAPKLAIIKNLINKTTPI
jgi:hypothetical protein